MSGDPLSHQRFEQGTHKYGDLLGDAQRAHENTQHARNLERQSFNWKAAILLLFLIAAAAGGTFLLYQVTGAADAPPSTYP